MEGFDARRTPPWVWLSLGLGSGLLITLLLRRAMRRTKPRRRMDPRARQVQELLAEAERLLHQGRRARPASDSLEP
ncbi:MAG: hypothetical protein ACOX9B_07230 [Candidatus Xenobium sp.]|jgi:hypothetical protein|nr:hypothetical protein [Burkholderiales bacterium]